jgi:hypothetical protein
MKRNACSVVRHEQYFETRSQRTATQTRTSSYEPSPPLVGTCQAELCRASSCSVKLHLNLKKHIVGVATTNREPRPLPDWTDLFRGRSRITSVVLRLHLGRIHSCTRHCAEACRSEAKCLTAQASPGCSATRCTFMAMLRR